MKARNPQEEAVAPFVTGCALAAASFLMSLFFGVMGLGAMFPEFAFQGLTFSVVAFASAFSIMVGYSVYNHLRRSLTSPKKP